MKRFRPVAIVLLLVACAAPASAQSIFSSGGLGVPVPPLGARERVLGGVGVGLYGSPISPVDPTAALGSPFGIIEGTMLPQTTSSDGTAGVTGSEGSRFPLMGIAYPVGSAGVATLTFGSLLDHEFTIRREGTVALGDLTVPVTDEFESMGGVSALRLGWARPVAPGVAVGASIGRYTGDIERLFSRSFDTTAVGAPVEDFRLRRRWSLTGTTVTVGGRWDPLPILRVATSASWSTELDADPEEPEDGEEGAFHVPAHFRVGGSARLTPELVLSAGVAWADWSDTGDDLSGADGAGTSVDTGAGLEWRGGRFLGRRLDLRLGHHWSKLPFELSGDQPSESYTAAGLGLNLAEAEGVPVAAIDLTVERGERDGAAISESFWRAAVTLRVAGR